VYITGYLKPVNARRLLCLAIYFISTLGKKRGPAYPCAATYSISIFLPSLSCGLNSFSRMNLPALCTHIIVSSNSQARNLAATRLTEGENSHRRVEPNCNPTIIFRHKKPRIRIYHLSIFIFLIAFDGALVRDMARTASTHWLCMY
jgi:hypothetical protein